MSEISFEELHTETETIEDKICLSAYLGDTELGFMDVTIIDSSIQITALHIYKEYRRMGIASYLLDELIDTACLADIPVSICCDFILEDETEDFHSFIDSRPDFLLVHDGDEYFVSADKIKERIQSSHLNKTKAIGTVISELTGEQTDAAIEAFKEFDLTVSENQESLTEIYDNELSLIAIENEKVKAGILAKKCFVDGNDAIEISAMMCRPGNEVFLVKLLAGFAARLSENYPDFGIRFFSINEQSRNFADKLLGICAVVKPAYSAIWLGI